MQALERSKGKKQLQVFTMNRRPETRRRLCHCAELKKGKTSQPHALSFRKMATVVEPELAAAVAAVESSATDEQESSPEDDCHQATDFGQGMEDALNVGWAFRVADTASDAGRYLQVEFE